ncbi:UPF0715 family protein [Peribacillus frigoritolerans]|uniref:UPF0715 family protein n=1 Tax=Peribacillus frigoritolerans TaxID=450367 RepID=UPI00207AB086|nr:UPF0715 family protein [Peribacillus frigoritolerans]USK73929.1 UPF0715 family protein [Peribacillus frigoritolerans]
MELWKISQKVSELSDVIPYYFFSLVSSCLSLSTVMVAFSLDTWGMIGIIVNSFYVVIPYLLFAVPVQVLFNKHPKKFSLNYFCLYIFFSLPAIFIYSSVLNFDFSMDILTTKNYYAISLFAALFFWFWDSVFLQKKALHHKTFRQTKGTG